VTYPLKVYSSLVSELSGPQNQALGFFGWGCIFLPTLHCLAWDTWQNSSNKWPKIISQARGIEGASKVQSQLFTIIRHAGHDRRRGLVRRRKQGLLINMVRHASPDWLIHFYGWTTIQLRLTIIIRNQKYRPRDIQKILKYTRHWEGIRVKRLIRSLTCIHSA
jgi:hypothetical protein